MKKYLLLSLLVSTLSSFSQSWAPIGAKWTYNASWVFATYPVIDIAVWEAIDTASFVGKKCTRISREGPYVDGDYRDYFHTYEENDVIYFYNDSTDSFSTLYDFNKGVGESWILDINHCQISMKIVKTSFDTINGVAYKSLDIEYDSVLGTDTYEMHANRLFGGADRPLPFYDFICNGVIPDGKYYQGLRCYEDSIVGTLNNSSLDCDYTSVGLDIVNDEAQIELYPNPGNGRVNLSFIDGFNRQQLIVTNSIGAIVNNDQLTKENTLLKINGPKGLYFIQIIKDGKRVKTLRYMKE